MKKNRYSEEQIAFALKQAETGTPVTEVIRRMGISEQTVYRWKNDRLDGGKIPHERRADPGATDGSCRLPATR